MEKKRKKKRREISDVARSFRGLPEFIGFFENVFSHTLLFSYKMFFISLLAVLEVIGFKLKGIEVLKAT